MKNRIIILVSIVLMACSSSHDVVHSGFLQKRKYSKGYNLSFKKSSKTQKEEKEELLVKEKDNQIVPKDVGNKELVFFDSLIDIENENLLIASSDNEYGVKVYSLIEKIERQTSLKILDTEKKKQKLEELLKQEKSENKSTYTLLFIFGILSIPLIFGVFMLFRIKKIGKEKINSSKKLSAKSVMTLFIYLLGLGILAGVIALSSQSAAGNTGALEQLIYLAFFGLFGLVILVLGIGMLVDLFAALDKVAKGEELIEEEKPIKKEEVKETKKEEAPPKKKIEISADSRDLIKKGFMFLLVSALVLAFALLLDIAFASGGFFLFAGSVLAGVSAVFFIMALVFNINPNPNSSVKLKEEQNNKKPKADVESEKEKRTRILSHVFTWATALFPLFIIPAIIYNIKVINDAKMREDKKRKNRAIWRLIALPLLAFIGLVVFVAILEGLGIITASAA